MWHRLINYFNLAPDCMIYQLNMILISKILQYFSLLCYKLHIIYNCSIEAMVCHAGTQPGDWLGRKF